MGHIVVNSELIKKNMNNRKHLLFNTKRITWINWFQINERKWFALWYSLQHAMHWRDINTPWTVIFIVQQQMSMFFRDQHKVLHSCQIKEIIEWFENLCFYLAHCFLRAILCCRFYTSFVHHKTETFVQKKWNWLVLDADDLWTLISNSCHKFTIQFRSAIWPGHFNTIICFTSLYHWMYV